MLITVYLLATLTFVIRLACAPFSAKVSAEMRRHPIVHWIWGGSALIGVLVFMDFLNPWWPPSWVERRGQRQKVLERVEAAGGWSAIQRDCDSLAAQYRDGIFYWHRFATNALPPALAALDPWEVRFDSPTVLREFKD